MFSFYLQSGILNIVRLVIKKVVDGLEDRHLGFWAPLESRVELLQGEVEVPEQEAHSEQRSSEVWNVGREPWILGIFLVSFLELDPPPSPEEKIVSLQKNIIKNIEKAACGKPYILPVSWL